MAKRSKKNPNEARVAAAFHTSCSGITINIMDTVKVMKHGLTLVEGGADDAELANGLRTFVEGIRVAS